MVNLLCLLKFKNTNGSITSTHTRVISSPSLFGHLGCLYPHSKCDVASIEAADELKLTLSYANIMLPKTFLIDILSHGHDSATQISAPHRRSIFWSYLLVQILQHTRVSNSQKVAGLEDFQWKR
jgi:hypothetical protein